MNVPRRLAHCGGRILDHVRDRVWESPLKVRAKLMAETADLERDKPEISECNKKEEEMKGFDPCLWLKDGWWCVTNINEVMGVLMEEKKG